MDKQQIRKARKKLITNPDTIFTAEFASEYDSMETTDDLALPQTNYPEDTPTLLTQRKLLDDQQQQKELVIQTTMKRKDVSPPVTDEQGPKFKTPRKVTKIRNLLRPVTPVTKTQNHYTPLERAPDPERQVSEKTAATNVTNKPRTTSPKNNLYCPPIVLEGITADPKELTIRIKQYAPKGFFIKYALRTTLVYIKDSQEHKNFKERMIEEETHFYTYATPEDKQHAFVLRGLHAQASLEDIKEEMEEEHEIEVKTIYRMKTKREPLFLVIVDNKVTLKTLSTQVKHLLYTKITWERRQNNRLINQCRRCQQWGHATTNCYRQPRCVKCALPHWSRDCVKTLEEPPKCANCMGAHTASNLDCPVYRNKLESFNQRNPQPT